MANVKSVFWSVNRDSKYGATVSVGYDVRVTQGGEDPEIKRIIKTFDDDGFVEILATKYFATEVFSDDGDVFTWVKKQVDDTKSNELLELYNAWKLTKDIIDKEKQKEEETTENEIKPKENNITSMFKGVTGSTIDTEKQKVEENIKNTSVILDDVKTKAKNESLLDLGDTKLSTFASSLGIDATKLSSLSNIVSDISISSIDLNNSTDVKKMLLEKITEKGLTGDLLNKDLLENIGNTLKLNPNELENMISSQNSFKILADIKSIDQFTSLDQTVKDKIAQNNFLPDTNMLSDVMSVSINLSSPDKSKKDEAKEVAKTLQPKFAKLFGMDAPQMNTVTINEPTGVMGAKTVEKLPFFIFSDNIDPNSFTKNGKPKKPIVVFTPKGYTGEDRLTPDKELVISDDGIVINNGIPYAIREIQYTSGDNVIQLLYDNYINIKDVNDEYRVKLEKWIESMDANARKKGRDPLKPILEYKTESKPVIIEDSTSKPTGDKNFIENFDKLDYRVQKVAAESMGFSDDVGGVAKLKEVLEKMKEYKRLDEISMSLKETLLSHVETLNKQQTNNNETIPTYKEQHNITDQQYNSAIEMAYSIKNIEDGKERFEYETNTGKTIDEIKREVLQDKNTQNSDSKNSIPEYLKLDISLFQKDSNGKIIEPFIYSGDVVLTDKKDQSGNALTRIPIKFDKVLGNFICKNMDLISLENAPNTVTGNFDCSNNELKNLVGGPKNVYGTYYAMNCNLQSLKGVFTVKNIDVSNNKLVNLDSEPSSNEQPNLFISGDGNFSNNLINSLISNIDIHGEFNLSKNFINEDSFEVGGNSLPRLYSNASLIINNQLNEIKLNSVFIRQKLGLKETTKVVN